MIRSRLLLTGFSLLTAMLCFYPASAFGGMVVQTLTISQDTRCSTRMVVPADTFYRFVNGARLVNGGGCSIEFQGMGLVDPQAKQAVFAGFTPGQIKFTGTTAYPKMLSSELWGGGDTPIEIKYAAADAAVLGKAATIFVVSGAIGGQLTVSEYHTLHFGAGDFRNNSDVGPQIILRSHTRLTGDGRTATTVRESSSLKPQTTQLAYGAGVVSYPFDGAIEDVTVDGLRFYSATDRPFDTASSAVFLGNVTGGSIHDCEFDSLHGFGAYVGGFADPRNSGKPHYAEDFEIYDNLFENMGAQEAGVIQGRNVRIHNNRFIKIGRLVKLVNDGVANNSATLTSQSASFPAHYVGSAVSVLKGNAGITTNIIAVPDPHTIVLAAPVPFAGRGVTIKVHNPFQSVIDLEPNHPNDILENISVYDNFIDASDAVYYANGIVAQMGGALSTRNIRIENNQILGCDDPNAPEPRRNISIGIALIGGNGAVVSGNTIRCTGQPGMSISNTVRSSITGNDLSVVGGGGNPGLQVIGSRGNRFADNKLLKIGTESQDDSVTETEYSGTASLGRGDGSTSLLTVLSGVGFYPHNVGSEITIGGGTYAITAWLDVHNVKIARGRGEAVTTVGFTTRYNQNTYSNSGTVVPSR